MLKRFFAAFLGSMAAIWISVGILAVGGIVFLIMALGSALAGSQSPDGSILLVDLDGTYADRETAPSVQALVMGADETTRSHELLMNAIRYAARDSHIKGIALNCRGASMGLALREELVEALEAFKKSGKWIYAYADSYSQGDYYVAAVADSFFLNPVGAVDVRGLATQTPFFKNALDKLGVEVQIVKVGTFKSAVEPFILTEASEPSKMQTRVFLDAIWGNITQSMARNLDTKPETINAWADSIAGCWPAERLVRDKVVSALAYRHQFEDRLRRLTDTDEDDDLPVVTPAEYMAKADLKVKEAVGADGKHIAVYYAVGDISDSGNEGIVGGKVTDDILDLADDDDVSGLVLRVNSGGGSAFASEQIWEALEQFKKSGKPFYVSMADYAASGGYYISCGADRIYADANTLTGSIGIFGMMPCVKGLMTDHLGINMSTVQTNPNADMGTITSPLTPQQHQALQKMVEDGYRLFTGRVAAGRDMPVDSVLKIAEGRVWDGRTALRIGLVDELGSLSKAIGDMGAKLNMKKPVYVTYPKVELSPVEKLLTRAAGGEAAAGQASLSALTAKAQFQAMTPDEARQCVRVLRIVTSGCPLQARMEGIILN